LYPQIKRDDVKDHPPHTISKVSENQLKGFFSYCKVFSIFFFRLVSRGLTVMLNCISMGGEGRYITLTKNYCIFSFIQEKGFE